MRNHRRERYPHNIKAGQSLRLIPVEHENSHEALKYFTVETHEKSDRSKVTQMSICVCDLRLAIEEREKQMGQWLELPGYDRRTKSRKAIYKLLPYTQAPLYEGLKTLADNEHLQRLLSQQNVRSVLFILDYEETHYDLPKTKYLLAGLELEIKRRLRIHVQSAMIVVPQAKTAWYEAYKDTQLLQQMKGAYMSVIDGTIFCYRPAVTREEEIKSPTSIYQSISVKPTKKRTASQEEKWASWYEKLDERLNQEAGEETV